MNFVSTISLIFISINCLNGEENGSSKIVGGQVTEIENFPYLAQLVFKKVQICGASIISNLWLISAAHCYDKDNIILSDYTIRTGSSRRTRGGKIHEIEQMTPNPNYFYDSPRVDFDLLLIKVKRSILFSDRQRPIKLPINDNPISIGTEVVVVGWGDTKDNKESNEILRALVMNTISIDLCKNRISAVDISFNVICTDTPPPAIQTTCKGDDGGPLEQTSNGELIGVASFIGIGPDKTCVLPEYGTVFAKISVARDWIEELTGV